MSEVPVCLRARGIDDSNGGVSRVKRARGLNKINGGIRRGQVINDASEILKTTPEAAGAKR